MKPSIHRLHSYFEGHVQGVGFRYQVLQIAAGFEVSGTVQNLVDGRVELWAEGDLEELKAFQAEIESQMEGYITQASTEITLDTRQFRGFRIVREA